MGIFDKLFYKKTKSESSHSFSNESLKKAVSEWIENEGKAMKKYGHISNWNVSNVTDLSHLFDGPSN